MKKQIQLRINGESYDLLVEPQHTLLRVLRENLEITGTKKGCETGDCGACTVLLNGRPVNACLVLAVEANGMEITTIEGLAKGNELHPLQEAFIEYGAVQCGFCTPGMILVAKALLEEQPDPTETDVKRAISGNICRCTGYVRIIKAIMAVAKSARLSAKKVDRGQI